MPFWGEIRLYHRLMVLKLFNEINGGVSKVWVDLPYPTHDREQISSRFPSP